MDGYTVNWISPQQKPPFKVERVPEERAYKFSDLALEVELVTKKTRWDARRILFSDLSGSYVDETGKLIFHFDITQQLQEICKKAGIILASGTMKDLKEIFERVLPLLISGELRRQEIVL
ncbi:MAG: hypothetical protein ABIB98_03885 [bacterium]